MSEEYAPPRLLTRQDEVAEFSSASASQTAWFRHHARQAQSTGTAKVFVVVSSAESKIVGYYAWSMASVAPRSVPSRMQRGAGSYPQPVALLSRLSVSEHAEGRGIGAGMLRDVLIRLVALSNEIGLRGLLIHCENEDARAFYKHIVPGFDNSPTDPLHLLLLMKDLRRTLQA